MSIGILEVQAAAAAAVIDDAGLARAGIGPVGQALVADAAEGGVEVLVADQKCVVLGRDRLGGFGEVQGNGVVGRYVTRMPTGVSRAAVDRSHQTRSRRCADR